jgi:3-deoxy-7-phosphoheptulonate synthase
MEIPTSRPERGIRTFETYTRNTLDLAAVAVAKKESHLLVIVDPARVAAGRTFRSLCCGAVATGADGLLVEVHPNPAEALSGQQQVDFFASKACGGYSAFLAAANRTGQPLAEVAKN